MPEGYITLQTYVTLTIDQDDRITACARDLDLSYDEVLRAVVNTSVRRHFERFASLDEEVTGDA